MSSIISKENLKKLENTRKYILKAAIWLLVGGVVLGAITILVGGSSSGEIIGKFMGTMFIVALMMMISVNNFKRIAVEEPAVQIFALIGLVSNLVWTVLWTILCWNPELGEVCKYGSTGYYSYGTICTATVMSGLLKSALVFSCLSALGLAGSNILVIYEGNKKSMIRPLKITAVVCASYEFLYFIFALFQDFNFQSEFLARLGMLSVFTGFAWFAIVIVALILSSNEKTKNKPAIQDTDGDETAAKAPKPAKTEAELRAEIEEQVRKEMIEKEVRAKIEAEQSSADKPKEASETSSNTDK